MQLRRSSLALAPLVAVSLFTLMSLAGLEEYSVFLNISIPQEYAGLSTTLFIPLNASIVNEQWVYVLRDGDPVKYGVLSIHPPVVAFREEYLYSGASYRVFSSRDNPYYAWRMGSGDWYMYDDLDQDIGVWNGSMYMFTGGRVSIQPHGFILYRYSIPDSVAVAANIHPSTPLNVSLRVGFASNTTNPLQGDRLVVELNNTGIYAEAKAGALSNNSFTRVDLANSTGLLVAAMYEYHGGIWLHYVVVYTAGNTTRYAAGSLSLNTTLTPTLYYFIGAHRSGISVLRAAGFHGGWLRLLARGEAGFAVHTPVAIGSLIKLVEFNSFKVIEYTDGSLRVYDAPPGAEGLVFKGLSGYRLTLYIHGFSISKEPIPSDNYVLSGIPLGFTAYVVVSPHTATVSIVSTAIAPRATRVTIPAPVPIQMPHMERAAPRESLLTYTLTAALSAIGIAVYKSTRRVEYGLAVPGVAAAFIGAAMGDQGYIAVGFLILSLALALSFKSTRS